MRNIWAVGYLLERKAADLSEIVFWYWYLPTYWYPSVIVSTVTMISSVAINTVTMVTKGDIVPFQCNKSTWITESQRARNRKRERAGEIISGSQSLWLTLWLTLSLTLSNSLWLSHWLSLSPNLLTRPYLGSQPCWCAGALYPGLPLSSSSSSSLPPPPSSSSSSFGSFRSHCREASGLKTTQHDPSAFVGSN